MSDKSVVLQDADISIGEVWQHHGGGQYVIINFTNKDPKPGWVTNVIYVAQSKPDDWYNRPLVEFLDKFKRVVV